MDLKKSNQFRLLLYFLIFKNSFLMEKYIFVQVSKHLELTQQREHLVDKMLAYQHLHKPITAD